MVTFVMKHGAESEAKNTNGQTPLIIAAINDCRDAAEALLAQGANLQSRDGFKGQTALHHAAFSGRIEMVAPLPSQGADINARDDSESATALRIAIGGGARHDLIELLIAEGGDLSTRDHAGVTPLKWAHQYALPETSDLLRSLGARE